jgi:hypothetical protein
VYTLVCVCVQLHDERIVLVLGSTEPCLMAHRLIT